MANHARSTGRLDIEAAWEEPVDDVAQDVPSVLAGAAHVADFQLEAVENACRIGRDDAPRSGEVPPVHKVRHEFRDTKHRDVRYHATATTRFREYFPPEITGDPGLITHVGPDLALDVPSSKRPDPPEVLYVVPTLSWEDESFRALLPEELRADLTPALARAAEAMPASLRRAVGRRAVLATEVPRAVRLPPVRRRTRKAGLRVYLSRAWYSSGDGELLAAVVPDQPYLVWPLDVGRGIGVDALTRTHADEVATQVLASQSVTARRTRSGLSASERLLRNLDRAGASTADMASSSGRLTAVQTSSLADILALPGLVFRQSDPEGFVTRYGRTRSGFRRPRLRPVDPPVPLRHAVGRAWRWPRRRATRWPLSATCPLRPPSAGSGTATSTSTPGPRTSRSSAWPWPATSRPPSPACTCRAWWAQLAAAHTATVSRSGSRAHVTVRGPGGYTDAAEGLLGRLAAKGPEGMALSRFAVARVERLPAGAVSDLAWVPVGDEARLDLELAAAYADVRFTGALPVPAKATGEQLRLALREYEILGTDPSQAEDHIVASGSPASMWPTAARAASPS